MAAKRYLITFILLSTLVFMLLHPQIASESARSGLALWYQNLVPVLFPFMLLSNLMIRLDIISVLLKWFHPILHLIWGTSVYGSYAILAGFLFGYPMGAKTIHDLLQQDRMEQAEAEYLIGFVNNLSPAFLISFLVGENLKKPVLLHPTLCILYGAPLLTSMVFAPKYRKRISSKFKNTRKAPKVLLPFELIDACIFDGITNITRLGVYLIFFSVLGGALNILPITNVPLRCVLHGSIEITSGIRYICGAPLPESTRYLLLMILCSFGGVCAFLQTLSTFPMSRSTMVQYIKARLVTITFSAVLTLVLFF